MSLGVATKRPYLSGWCGTADHGRCRGAYAGTECGCRCHSDTPAAPEAVSVDPGGPAEPAIIDDLPSLLHDDDTECPTCGRPWRPSIPATPGAEPKTVQHLRAAKAARAAGGGPAW